MPKFDTLTSKGRDRIAPENFVFPKDQRYPIHDISHARNALARSSGTADEDAVKKAVYAKYPSLRPDTKLIERGFFKSSIQLASGNAMGGKPETPGAPTSLANPDVQMLRVGKFKHPVYGDFEITKQVLAEMKANFDNKIRGVDIAFDYFHNSDEEASGWPTELYLTEDGTQLWAKVDWTPKAQQKLQEREIRYFSPDFAFQWEDPETGKVFSNVLFGGGLTNRPFVKEMAAIVASETKGESMNEKEIKEMQAQLVKLAEDQKALKEQNVKLQEQLDDSQVVKQKAADKADPDGDAGDDSVDSLKAKLAEMSAQYADLKQKHEALMAEKKMAEKDAAFSVLLTEGKACAAQKDAFIKGDMETFVKLAQPLNLEGKGHVGGGNDSTEDRDDKVLKLADEMCAKDSKLSRGDAIRLANKQVK